MRLVANPLSCFSESPPSYVVTVVTGGDQVHENGDHPARTLSHLVPRSTAVGGMWNIGPERVINQLLQRGAALSWVNPKAQGPSVVESLGAAWTNVLGPVANTLNIGRGSAGPRNKGESRTEMDLWVPFPNYASQIAQRGVLMGWLWWESSQEPDQRRMTATGTLEPEQDTADTPKPYQSLAVDLVGGSTSY